MCVNLSLLVEGSYFFWAAASEQQQQFCPVLDLISIHTPANITLAKPP